MIVFHVFETMVAAIPHSFNPSERINPGNVSHQALLYIKDKN